MTTTDAVVAHALRAATRAPSVHTTRPWRFVVASPVIERDRVLAVVDPATWAARPAPGLTHLAAERASLHLLGTRRALATVATVLRRADHLLERGPRRVRELRGWAAVTGGRADRVPPVTGGPRRGDGSLLTLRRFRPGATERVDAVTTYAVVRS